MARKCMECYGAGIVSEHITAKTKKAAMEKAEITDLDDHEWDAKAHLLVINRSCESCEGSGGI